MAKSKKQNQTLAYIPELYPEDTNSSVVSNAVNDYTGGTGVYIVDGKKKAILEGQVNESVNKGKASSTTTITDSVWLMDIAQSHHYAVELQGFEKIKSPQNRYSTFLPVKTMNLKYTSYENMSIPVAIFGDFPLLNKKRVSTIDLTCYDTDDNKIEYQLRQWEASCFPKGRFVAYMYDIARKFEYRGYNVKGQQTLKYGVWVIPAGNVTVGRDVSANDAKLINFSLVVVGDGQTCATGPGKQPKEVNAPISKNMGLSGKGGGGLISLYTSAHHSDSGRVIHDI